MGSSLGPILANIILTEFENVIVKQLIETTGLNFETFVLIKKDKIQLVLNPSNSFYTFDDDNIHFLDIKILNNGETDISIKDTNTGL